MNENPPEVTYNEETVTESETVTTPADSFVEDGCIRGERRGDVITFFKTGGCTCSLDLKNLDRKSAARIAPMLIALSN